MTRRNRYLILFVILVVGLALRINNLSGRSLWVDEFYTLFQSTGHGMIQESLEALSSRDESTPVKAEFFKAMMRRDGHKTLADVNMGLLKSDGHPPIYFWLVHYWLGLFGNSELALRSLSLLLGMFSIILAYKTGKYLFDEDAGIFIALFMSISAFAVRFSQEGRNYALLMAAGLLAWLFMLKYERSSKARYLAGYAICNGICINTHYVYILTALSQLIYFTIVYIKNDDLRRRFYVAFLVSFLGFIPWLITVCVAGRNSFLFQWPFFGYPGILNKIYYFYTGLGNYLFLFIANKIWLKALVLAGVTGVVFLAMPSIKAMKIRRPKALWYCAIVFLFPVSVLFLMDLLMQGLLLRAERFWLFSFFGIVPVGGYVLLWVFRKNRVFFSLLTAAMVFFSLNAAYFQFATQPKNFANWVNRESKEGAALVALWNIRSVALSYSYYLNDGIYVLPVADNVQLNKSLLNMPVKPDKVFLVRSIFRLDPSLMDKGDLELDLGAVGYKYAGAFEQDGVYAREYVKCGS